MYIEFMLKLKHTHKENSHMLIMQTGIMAEMAVILKMCNFQRCPNDWYLEHLLINCA